MDESANTRTTKVTDDEQACSRPSCRSSSTTNMCAPAIPSSPTLNISDPVAPERVATTANRDRRSSMAAQLQLRSASAIPGTRGMDMPANGYFTKASKTRGANRWPKAKLQKDATRTSRGARGMCAETTSFERYGLPEATRVATGTALQRFRERRSSHTTSARATAKATRVSSAKCSSRATEASDSSKRGPAIVFTPAPRRGSRGRVAGASTVASRRLPFAGDCRARYAPLRAAAAERLASGSPG